MTIRSLSVAIRLLLSVFLCSFCVFGCNSVPAWQNYEKTAAGITAIDRAHLRTEQIIANSREIKDTAERFVAKAIEDNAKGIQTDLSTVRDSLKELSASNGRLAGELKESADDNAKMRKDFWSVRQRRYFWLAVISLAGAAGLYGIAGLVFGFTSSPLIGNIGKEIVRALPLANPISWIRDAIQSFRAKRS